MATRPEIILKLHHKVPTSQKSSLILAVLTPQDYSHTNDVIINRSSISLHINFIRGHSAIQQGSINRVVTGASENLYH